MGVASGSRPSGLNTPEGKFTLMETVERQAVLHPEKGDVGLQRIKNLDDNIR